MKYNKEQFEVLVKSLRTLSEYIDIFNSNPHTLHFTVYQQFSEGQTHNHLYILDGDIFRAHKLTKEDLSHATKMFDFDSNFELYPNDCNDDNIETAMRNALKTLKNELCQEKNH